MTKLAPEWIRTSDPVIRSPARYRWTMAPAGIIGNKDRFVYEVKCRQVYRMYQYCSEMTMYIR